VAGLSTLSHNRQHFWKESHLKYVVKCGLCLYLQLLSGKFFLLKGIHLLIIVDIHSSKCEVIVAFVKFLSNLNFLDRFSKNPQISNFAKKKPPVGAEVFYVDGQTHDES
jgi:hypothetical protein